MHRSVCIKSQNIYKRGIFIFIFYNRGKSNGELELAVCFIRAVVCKQQVYLRSVNQTKKKKKNTGKKKTLSAMHLGVVFKEQGSSPCWRECKL